MIEIVKIVKLEKLGGFRLRLWFSDGTEGERDFPTWSARAERCRAVARSGVLCPGIFGVRDIGLAQPF